MRRIGAVLLLATLLWAPVPADSQIERRGTFDAQIWWKGEGKWHGIGEDRQVFAGELTGTIFNDAGHGFLHRASLVCPAFRDSVKGFVTAHGYCIVTDEEGDRSIFVWACKGLGRCEGDSEWLGGTGKYTGLRGRQALSGAVRATANPQADEGHATWKGRWELPEK